MADLTRPSIEDQVRPIFEANAICDVVFEGAELFNPNVGEYQLALEVKFKVESANRSRFVAVTMSPEVSIESAAKIAAEGANEQAKLWASKGRVVGNG